jgi:ELWxxDGT repeat protein
VLTLPGTRAVRVCGFAFLIIVAASSGLGEEALGAGPARRITDLASRPVPGVLSAGPAARINGVVYFPGGSFAGSGLYASDLATDRARLLKQLDAGIPVELDGRAFFLGAQGGISSLWTTDGTPAGTIPVAPLGDSASGLTAVGGLLYFLGPQSAVWRSDGTVLGTRPLPVRGSFGVFGVEFAELGGRVYFFGQGNDEDEIGLWQATRSGTVRRVADLGDANPPDSYQRFAYGLARVGNRLVFFTLEAGGVYRMWNSDGTEVGTAALRAFSPDYGGFCPVTCFPIGPSAPVSLGATGLFFANDGEHGRELWRTDGTTSGTWIVKDIQPGPVGSNWPGTFSYPGAISGAGASVHLFAADDGIHGDELWKTDGTEAGTTLVADLHPGPDGSQPYLPVAAGGAVFFHALDLLWKSDGTAAGTQPFGGLEGYPFPLVEGVSFVTTSGLFVSDGANLTRVDDLARPGGLEPSWLTAGGARVFFTNPTQRELWTSDGTAPGTRKLRSFEYTGDLWSAGGRLYFTPADGSTGSNPWVSDGSDAGTHRLATISAFGGSGAGSFTAALGRVFFAGADSERGSELWSTDGTESGTRLVEDLLPGPGSSLPADFQPFRGSLYFKSWLPDPGSLWRTDGTEGGTVEVARLLVENLVAGTDALFFLSWDEAHGRELWRSDGTPTGTRRVSDIVPGPEGAYAGMLTPAGTRLFFSVRGPFPPSALWISDESGTRRIREFSGINWIAPFAGGVLLSASDGETGRELWRSDGTAEGTVLVRDALPGPGGSEPSSPAIVGGVVLFAAQDADHGRELWRTDGTEEGTFLLQDLAPGPASSTPERLTLAGRLVYFRATDEEVGAQLWALPASALSPRPADAPRPTRIVPPRD